MLKYSNKVNGKGTTVQRVFKVLHRGPDGKLYSAIIDLPRWKTEYKVGIKTVPQAGTLLYASPDLDAAVTIAQNYFDIRKLEVWEAEAETVDETPFFSLDHTEKAIEEFWQRKQAGIEMSRTCDDHSTVWCKWIRLVNKVSISKPDSVKVVYDNPRRCDRYTVVINKQVTPSAWLAFTLDPAWIQEYSQWGEIILPSPNLGQEIAWDNLPLNIQKRIAERVQDYLPCLMTMTRRL
jgi:hypothetical protein